MEKQKLFLISGKARHGKGSTSEFIKEFTTNLGLKSLEINNGDYVKDIATRHFGWNGEKDEVGRDLLQYVGTDVCRKNNPDIWVNIVNETILGLRSLYPVFTVADVRFPNEIEIPKDKLDEQFDIFNIRVIRFNQDGSFFDNRLTQKQKDHISETALDNYTFDWVLCAKDLTELKSEVIEMMKYYMNL